MDLCQAGLAEDNPFPRGLDKTSQGPVGGSSSSVQRPLAEEAEVTPGARTRLKCNESQRTLSWSIESTAHGGRATLEEVKNNPGLMDEIHVVFFPMA